MGVLVFLSWHCLFWLWVITGPSLSSIKANHSLRSSVFCFILLGLVFTGCCDFLFASARSEEVFVGLRFRRSGFWALCCGSCPWPLWLRHCGLVSFWFSKRMSPLGDVWVSRFSFLTSFLRQDVWMCLFPTALGLLSLCAYAEDLGVFSFSLSSASSLSVLAAHFLGGGWLPSAFVPLRLHFWQSQGTPCRTF